ncbi:MDR/zinc-dependent alcohol dehydrogenase-like family protein [Streptomyces niveiscabiei]|uniref:Alcohol dehydrogenase-like C-terminal domain-containing protein n=1 Tax=Streptomyces niveiscabiei TaxID=164115 RepID=A0ABW9HHK7_9ACTN
MEAACVVDQIGAGTETDLRVDDHVMPSRSSSRPSRWHAHPAARATYRPMNGLTARLALDTLRLAAAAGTVGGYAVQRAKADGPRVVADASERDEALGEELGADIVLEPGAGSPDRVRAEVPEGFDGASLGVLTARAVRDRGRLLTPLAYGRPGERGIVHELIVRRRRAGAVGRFPAAPAWWPPETTRAPPGSRAGGRGRRAFR